MRGLLEQGVHVATICDVSEGSRREGIKAIKAYYDCGMVTRPYPGCDTTGDFREVIGRRNIDAVMIATPDHWHAIPVLEATRAGKAIYCEKPLALTIRQG